VQHRIASAREGDRNVLGAARYVTWVWDREVELGLGRAWNVGNTHTHDVDEVGWSGVV
jgi:hypothetical protein